jgi:hypothetical protein
LLAPCRPPSSRCPRLGPSCAMLPVCEWGLSTNRGERIEEHGRCPTLGRNLHIRSTTGQTHFCPTSSLSHHLSGLCRWLAHRLLICSLWPALRSWLMRSSCCNTQAHDPTLALHRLIGARGQSGREEYRQAHGLTVRAGLVTIHHHPGLLREASLVFGVYYSLSHYNDLPRSRPAPALGR